MRITMINKNDRSIVQTYKCVTNCSVQQYADYGFKPHWHLELPSEQGNLFPTATFNCAEWDIEVIEQKAPDLPGLRGERTRAMTGATHKELDRICTEICDNICRWPHQLEDKEALDEKCAGCQALVDLANLAEKLERKASRHKKEA